MTKLIVGVDFDGTVVTHDFPHIGKDIGAIPYLRQLNALGVKLILHTMRSDEKLEEAATFLKNQGVELWGLNMNPEQKSWTNSTKPYCNIFVDDAALGCPLAFNPKISNRNFVDWKIVGPQLLNWAKMELSQDLFYTDGKKVDDNYDDIFEELGKDLPVVVLDDYTPITPMVYNSPVSVKVDPINPELIPPVPQEVEDRINKMLNS